MEHIDMEVYFFQYCPICEHSGLKETKDPCNECLTHFFNQNSHKPVFFKEDTTKAKSEAAAAAR